jgi:hypothetical protein
MLRVGEDADVLLGRLRSRNRAVNSRGAHGEFHTRFCFSQMVEVCVGVSGCTEKDSWARGKKGRSSNMFAKRLLRDAITHQGSTAYVGRKFCASHQRFDRFRVLEVDIEAYIMSRVFNTGTFAATFPPNLSASFAFPTMLPTTPTWFREYFRPFR